MKIKLIFICLLLFTYLNSFSQSWQYYDTYQGSGTTSMQVNKDGDLFFTTASFNYPSGQSAGIYRILNGSFITVIINPSGGTAFNARTIETEGNSVWASYWGNPAMQTEGLYYSSNKGNSWTNTFSAGTSNNIFSVDADPDNNNVLIGTRNGVYKSTNNGMNFSMSNSGMASNSWTYDIEKAGDSYFAATSNGLYKSSNEGTDWTMASGISLPDTPKVIGVIPAESGHKIYVGTSRGKLFLAANPLFVFVSVFEFTTSQIIAFMLLRGSNPSDQHFWLSSIPQNFDALGNGVFYAYNSETLWTYFDGGLPLPNKVSSLGGIRNGNTFTLFAGTFDNTASGVRIYKRDYTVGINNITSEVPGNFSLSQNFPNPFNPSTKIRFEIQTASEVKLIIYNSLGKEISTLVNENLNAGTYETDFNGGDYNSGVYFYKLFITGEKNFIETRKMILTK